MKTTSPLFPFQHKEILQTALPLGGIGAGCVCLNGYGSLQDFSIRNHPETSAWPESHSIRDAAFALLHVKGGLTRLLEGPFPSEKIFDQGLQGNGRRHAGFEGLPRFRSSKMRSGYPFGRVELSDPGIPLAVAITGWNPFIPRDEIASGIPCAILEYTFRNSSRKKVEFDFSYHLSHLAEGAKHRSEGTRNDVIPGKGVFLSNIEAPTDETYASASLTVVGHRPAIKAMWLRGAWFDAISALWREVEGGKFTRNDGQEDSGKGGRNGGSILMNAVLAPGEEITFPVVIAWHFPNTNVTHGQVSPPDCCPPGDSSCCAGPKWRPFYVSQWKDAREVALYVDRNFESLRQRTVAFQRALFGSSFPPEVLDAISANLAILKSPTVLRQENGNMWGWEGCFADHGCCDGSCTHVWNYAQAFPNLYPQLERTLREQEMLRSMDERGHVNFRSSLPDGPAHHRFHAASDGQLGGIMKLYRDWQTCGDTKWLEGLYPLAKRSLDFCIGHWDPDRKGGLFEPHHNTYDIEFWGPDGMCGSIYLGALCAMSAMAAALGKEDDGKQYGELAGRAGRFMEKELFNGEYFQQKVQYKGLRDTSFVELITGKKAGKGGEPPKAEVSNELIRLMKKEGPKYQYGTGCISDGVIGAWMARIYGIDIPLDRTKIRKNLLSIHRYNFKKSLLDHANTQRPGYAWGDEPGLLLCTWPRGKKPTLPFPYSDEAWTGIEYQVASHLIAEGCVREGLEIVKAVRDRHTGRTRNPWNEYECGNYYARAMASYALLSAISGFRYSAVEKTLWFGPKLNKRPFTSFFSTAAAHGTITLYARSVTVSVLEGELALDRIILEAGKKVMELSVAKRVRPGKPVKVALSQTKQVISHTK